MEKLSFSGQCNHGVPLGRKCLECKKNSANAESQTVDTDAKTKRKHLRNYSAAYRDIELTGVAIEILEKVSGTQRVIAALNKLQSKQLSMIDAAAAKLGAPYGA